MDAAEARKKTMETIKAQMFHHTNLDKMIDTATAAGKFSISINLIDSGLDWRAKDLLEKELKEIYGKKGFAVQRNNGSDCRDGDSWDSISISW